MYKLLILVSFYMGLSPLRGAAFPSNNGIDTSHYKQALIGMKEMLEGVIPLSFKRAVYLSENAYLSGKLDENEFNIKISKLRVLAYEWMKANNLINYNYSDSANFLRNLAIYKILKDTIRIQLSQSTKVGLLPFVYDFNDFNGIKNWTNMFVSKLLNTHKGNCHSLPYLYKILADELEAKCWLSLAPNHLYIKNKSKKIGWYNTELTSGTFPVDAWVMASGYVPIEAVQSKIYMDTLSNQQAIALCVLDIAKGYERQTKNYYDGFIVECCNLVLKYHPQNVMAILLKAETMKKLYLKEQADKYPRLTYTPIEMAKLYGQLFDLGYREMPDKMYLSWLQSLNKEKAKYTNQQIGNPVRGK
jgi:hypothetical protein